MCGIAGIVGQYPGGRGKIRTMIAALHHRGPDGEGFHDGDGAHLGHARLSINDLAGGAQPLYSDDRRLVLIANGEIYNSPHLRRRFLREGYAFSSKSDVEVILPLYQRYGEDCVKHLQGMFAFAIYDVRDHRVFLARDHLGQKPLFYAVDEGGVRFASEIKAIRSACDAKPAMDTEALWHYMSMRFVPDDMTLFAGVRKLPAATTLSWCNGTVNRRRYWTPDFNAKHRASDTELIAELDQRLRGTVCDHLLSDVPVGAFLSGGIDSGLISAMMALGSPEPVNAYAIGVKEQGWNEIPHAQLVADRYSMQLTSEVVTADLVSVIPRMVYHLDEPADPYAVGVFLVSRLAAKNIKVVLTGDGGDESFAGYDRYAGQRYAQLYARVPAALRNIVLARAIRMIPDSFGYKSVAARARWMSDLANVPAANRYAHSLSILRFPDADKRRLFRFSADAHPAYCDSDEKILQHFNSGNASRLVDRMLYTDLMTRIPDHLCVIADRMCMAHSLENRSPFLDHELVQWVASLPVHLKLRGNHLKVALRRLGAGYLPPSIVRRPKQGFGFPIASWLRNELSQVMNNAFAESRLVDIGLFDPGFMGAMLNQHQQGRRDHNFRLWMLLNLEIWYRMHIEGENIDTMAGRIDDWMANTGRRCA